MSLGLLPQLQKNPYCPAKPSLDSWGVHHNKLGVLTSLNKQKFLMSSPAVTREYNPASCCNSRKTVRLPAHWKMRAIPLHCVQSNSLFTIKQVRRLDLLDGSTESPPEIPHKSRRTLMPPQECEIFGVAQINSRLSPIPLHWLQNNYMFPIIHDKWLDFL